MSEPSQKETLQDVIRRIQRDTGLNAKEKSQKISQTMREWNQRKAQQNAPVNTTQNTNNDTPEVTCTHYERGCDIQCPTCKKFYPCRICHDENENHKLDRFKVDTVRCKTCRRIQGAAKNCQYCNTVFGHYYCDICHLWQNDGTPIFHCDKCGICRVGKKEDYVHCDKCNHCYTKEWFKTHKCIPDATKIPCAICGDSLYDSRKTIQVLKCGHCIHEDCLKQLTRRGEFRCPYCKKSILEMGDIWKQYDLLAQEERLPPEYEKKRMVIYCCDCEKKSDIKYSFEFCKCVECGSYNTCEDHTYDRDDNSQPGASATSSTNTISTASNQSPVATSAPSPVAVSAPNPVAGSAPNPVAGSAPPSANTTTPNTNNTTSFGNGTSTTINGPGVIVRRTTTLFPPPNIWR